MSKVKQPKKPLSAVVLQRFVRLKRGLWLYSFDLAAEVWNGAFKTLEEAIEDAVEAAHWDGPELSEHPVYIAHGCPTPKAECDDRGVEWPWYQVDPKTAIRVLLPNVSGQQRLTETPKTERSPENE